VAGKRRRARVERGLAQAPRAEWQLAELRRLLLAERAAVDAARKLRAQLRLQAGELPEQQPYAQDVEPGAAKR
jgi:hypothetical protein